MVRKEYGKQDDIPEALRSLYVEKGGKWILDLEDGEIVAAGTAEKLDQFRSNNIELQKKLADQGSELGDMRKRFSGIDPEQFGKYLEGLAKVEAEEEKKLLSDGRLDEVVRRRVAKTVSEKDDAIKSRDKALSDLRKERDALHQEIVHVKSADQILGLLRKKNMRFRNAVAEEDVRSVIIKDWTLDDDRKLRVARTDLIGENGEMTPEEYVDSELLKRRSYLFEEGQGGGGGGGDDNKETPSTKPVIAASDMAAKGKNLADIASGKVQVRLGE